MTFDEITTFEQSNDTEAKILLSRLAEAQLSLSALGTVISRFGVAHVRTGFRSIS